MLSFQSFSDELEKIAKSMSNAQKAEAHHSAEVKDWSMFENQLNSKGFQKAVVKHDLSDEKLRKYVEAFGSYLTAKKVVAKVPSRTSSANYDIRKLPGGRLGCGCKDWQYKHSWNGTDCDHIKMLSKDKVSSVGSIARAIRGAQLSQALKKEHKEGKEAKEFADSVTRPSNYFGSIDQVLTKKLMPSWTN